MSAAEIDEDAAVLLNMLATFSSDDHPTDAGREWMRLMLDHHASYGIEGLGRLLSLATAALYDAERGGYDAMEYFAHYVERSAET